MQTSLSFVISTETFLQFSSFCNVQYIYLNIIYVLDLQLCIDNDYVFI